MSFVARWLADALRLACALAFALAAMQVPALTHEYQVALLQVAQDARRDTDQRVASARDYYHLAADADTQTILATLGKVEPSNATTLRYSIDRTHSIENAEAHITQAAPLLQPLAALADTIAAPNADKFAVLQTTFANYVPQVMLQTAAATYGLIGLLAGAFIGNGLIALTASVAQKNGGDAVAW